MTPRRALSLILGVLCLALAAGCSETRTRVAEHVTSFEYVVVPASMQAGSVELVDQGVQEAAKELGVNATFGGTPFPDAEDQANLAESILSRPLKGLALEALSADTLAKAIESANDQQAPVISFGSEIARPARILHVQPVPVEETAERLMTILAMAAGGQGDVAIMAGLRQGSFESRLVRALQNLARTPRFKELAIRETLYVNDHPLQSQETALKLVEFYKDLRGIICTSSVALSAAGRVVAKQELAGKVAVTGLGLPGELHKSLRTGAVPAFLAFDPRDLGYLTLYALDAAAKGRVTGEPGQTLQAGRLGRFTVQPGGEVLLGRPARVDRSNADDFDF
jgi:rhamnose transport system substrate-binding protein